MQRTRKKGCGWRGRGSRQHDNTAARITLGDENCYKRVAGIIC